MSAHTPERRLARAGDAELITLTRKGDADAYAALFRRHASAAAAVARSVTSTFDADDLVSEAYTRVLGALQSGKGPTAAFRPYLFTTVRNVAASWGRAAAGTVAVAPEEFDEIELPADDGLAAIDRPLTVQAFRSLPSRWQEALWYSEVEGMQPAAIAPLLGLSAQATAALCYRAREGLRQAWIRAHLVSPDLGPECSWTVDRLAASVRGRLGKREQARVDAHLDTCAKCALVAAEAKDVGDRLALILLPLAIGAAGATAYLATVHAGAAGVTAGAVAGGAVAGGAGATASGAAGSSGGAGASAGTSAGAATASGGIFGGATGVIVGVAAAVVVVGASVAGVALAMTPTAHTRTSASTSGSLVSGDTSSKQPASDPRSTTPAPSAAPTQAAPAPSTAAQPSTAPSPSAGTEASTTAGTPTNPGTPTGSGTPTGPGTTTGTGGSSTPPDTKPEPPAPPVISTVDTGDGRYFPLVSGTALPSATITVTGAGQTLTTTAAADGTWTLSEPLTGYGAGTDTVTATQTDTTTGLTSAVASATFALAAPQASVTGAIRPGGVLVELTATGTPDSGYELIVDGTNLGVRTLSPSGIDARYLFLWPTGDHTLQVRYSDGSGRVGPATSTSFTTTMPY